MTKGHAPRHGSMQVWPRKRARREYPRVRGWASKASGMLGFAGYKAGMTHIFVTDNRKSSMTKGQDISYPVTVIECPPMKIAGVRFYRDYKNSIYGRKAVTDVLADKLDKELTERKITKPKKSKDLASIKSEDYDDLMLIVYTQPKLTGIGKKKPEIFEIGLGGSKEDKFNFAKEKLGGEIKIEDVFKEGEQVDIHAVTKGKGFQGPVKRFGVKIRQHKSEKTKRGPGSLGAWCGQGHMMYRVAHAGQMGYHTRLDYNKQIIKISKDVKTINPKGGFIRFGEVKNPFVLVKGSVPGPKKRLIRFNHAIRPNKKMIGEAPAVAFISTASQQGR